MKTTEKTKTQTEEILDTSSIEFDQMVQKLKKQYGAIYQIEIADQRFIFKPLSRKEYKEVMSLKTDEDDDSILMKRENLVAKYSIVYPSAKETEVLLERYAGIAEVICDECMKVSGFLNDQERTITKL
jgi:hypothetical protein